MDDKVLEILNKMGTGKRKYEENKAKKQGFASIEDYIKSKLEQQFQSRVSVDDANRKQQLQKEIRLTKEQNIWKLTNKDLEPHFSVHYLISKDRQPGSTHTSYEMMEWFLKTIGHLDPCEMEKGDWTKSTPDDFGIDYVDTCLWFLFGKYEINFDAVKSGSSNVIKSNQLVDLPFEPFEWFADLEHLVTNDHMFWFLFEFIWTAQNKFFTEECFNRYGRMKVPLRKRLECGELIRICTGYSGIYDGDSKYPATNFYMDTLDDNFTRQDELVIYRSFKVAKGQPIRKGIKADSPDASIHFEGSGWAYSFHKFVAHRLGWFITSNIIKKYCGVNDQRADRILEKQWLTEGQKRNPTFYDGFYTCIGKFTVKAEDIVFATGQAGEDEIIVNPKNVTLVDYRFLNFVDTVALQIAMNFVRGFGKTETEDGDSKYSHHTQCINLDGIYDFFWMQTKKHFKENPNKLSKYLESGLEKPRWMGNLTKEFLTNFEDELASRPNRKSKIDGRGEIEIGKIGFNHYGKNFMELSMGGFAFPEANGDSIRQRTRYTKADFDKISLLGMREQQLKKDNLVSPLLTGTQQDGSSLIQNAIQKAIQGD